MEYHVGFGDVIHTEQGYYVICDADPIVYRIPWIFRKVAEEDIQKYLHNNPSVTVHEIPYTVIERAIEQAKR